MSTLHTLRAEAKRDSGRKMAARRASVNQYATKDDVRAIGVVVERIESKLGALTEGLGVLRDELKTDIASLEQRLSARIAVLEEVVRKNSEDIRKNSEAIRQNSEDIRKNSEDIRLLRVEVAELRLRFDQRESRLDELERRISIVEQRLGIAG
jgi:chromosome segregation ATPase